MPLRSWLPSFRFPPHGFAGLGRAARFDFLCGSASALPRGNKESIATIRQRDGIPKWWPSKGNDATFGYLDPINAARARGLIEKAIADAALITGAGR